ncbi:hypothetical protein [Thauera butanivorans]|uniref:hypothetical protein n=1 Tax=Thauera butanivorans TaxID=86174 RepID=UPI000837FE34|nr:hypothetical protein [Thauera butanivorans]
MTPEPFSSTKLIPPIVGFFGAVIMLSYMHEVPTSQWATALLFGVLGAYFGPPVIVAWLLHTGIAWLPTDGSVEGLLGLAVGLLSIHFVGAIAVLGRRFSRDPTGFIKRRGGSE